METYRSELSVCCWSIASLFGKGFNSSKCRTMAKMASSRIKLLQNKRDSQVKQIRRDVAMLLESGQEATARIRVEHVIREQNIMAANEIIELFCELVVARLSIIAKQSNCPADLKEGVSSLIYAASRCSDIPELAQISGIFERRYGREFATAAIELRPNSGVNQTLIEKLSVRKPVAQVKMNILKEIAKEYQVEWDPTDWELLKPPEDVLEGPPTFIRAVSMPEKTIPVKDTGLNGSKNRGTHNVQFKDAASAARAAAEFAERAILAADAAACLAYQDFSTFQKSSVSDIQSSHNCAPFSHSDRTLNPSSGQTEVQRQNMNSAYFCQVEGTNLGFENGHDGGNRNREILSTGIKYVDADCDEEIIVGMPDGGDISPSPKRPQMEMPMNGLVVHGYSPGSHVHPRLPDYDALSTRFEALKH